MSRSLGYSPKTLRYDRKEETKQKIFFIALLINGCIGALFNFWSLFVITEAFWIYIVMGIGSLGIIGWGIYIHLKIKRYFRSAIVASAFAAMIGVVVSLDVLTFIPNFSRVFAIFALVSELILLCYNYSIGQKEDRKKLSKSKLEKNKKLTTDD